MSETSIAASSGTGHGNLAGVLSHNARSRLPQKLINAKRWMLWASVPDPDPTKKPCKVPHYADGSRRQGALDTPEDISRLATFDDALDALVFSEHEYAGLGFALGPDGTGGHWQGFDADNLTAEEVNAFLADHDDLGYAEVSPSGRGIHVIGYGRHFATLGPNGSNVEAYAGARFFTFTGDRGRGEPTCIAVFVEGSATERHRKIPATNGTVGTIQVDAKTVSELRSALASMRADDRDLWVRMGHALHELGDAGRALWTEWSQTSDLWKPTDAKQFDTFHHDRTGYQAVFAEAQRQGWVNPNSNAARLPPAPPQSDKTGAQWLDELTVRWDGPEDVEVPDIVDGLVADEEVTLLGGHGGIGKSFLALQTACAVATGQPILNHGTKPMRVLYYSAEDGRKRIARRLRRMVEYFDHDKKLLNSNLAVVDASDLEALFGETLRNVGAERPYLAKILGPMADFRKVQAMVEAFDPQLVVIDGASDTFDGNEISRREVRQFVRLLKGVHPRRKIGVLLLVHIDRSSARGHSSNDDGYSGNTQWHNSCRRRMYLQMKKERDDDGNEVGETILLRVMKNQDGPPAPDMELQRGLHGLWQLAMKFEGDLSPATMDHSETVLRLIDEYYRRGTFISTSLAKNATTGAYHALKGDVAFPPALSPNKTAELLRELERSGRLVKETYRRTVGGKAERWQVVRDAQYTAPGTDVQSGPSGT